MKIEKSARIFSCSFQYFAFKNTKYHKITKFIRNIQNINHRADSKYTIYSIQLRLNMVNPIIIYWFVWDILFRIERK